MNTNTDKFLYKLGLVLFVLITIIISALHIFQINYQIFSIPCIFNKVTGLYCPGCGGTRSVYAVLQAQPIRSIRYNPIVMYGILIYLWYMISNTIEYLSKHKIKIGMKYSDLYFWIGLILVLVFFIIRNIVLVAFGIDLTVF